MKRNDLNAMKRAREMTDDIEPCVQSVAYRAANDTYWVDKLLIETEETRARERDERRGRERDAL
jgi:hypothetical protein